MWGCECSIVFLLCFFNRVVIQLYSGEKCWWYPKLNTLRAKEKPTWKTDLSNVNNFTSHNSVDDCPRRRFWSWNSQLSCLPSVERSKTSLSLFQNIHTIPLNSNESPRARAQDTSTSSTVTYLRSTRRSRVTLIKVVLNPVSKTKNYKKIPKSFISPNKLGFIHVIYEPKLVCISKKLLKGVNKENNFEKERFGTKSWN